MLTPTTRQIDFDYSRLPAAPHVLIKLIDLFQSPDVSFDALEKIILKDTALCAKVISLSNSAAFSQWKDVKDLKRILVVVGLKNIKSITLTSAVHQFFSQFSKELGETLGSLWLDALICAHLSRLLAELTGYENPDEAHLAGLMHQLGQLVFLSDDVDRYQSLLASVNDQNTLLLKEQEHYGINSTDLAADIIDDWGIDSFLDDAVRYQYQPASLLQDAQPLVKLINLASQLCNRLNHRHQQFVVEDHFFALNQSIIEELVNRATQSAIADAQGFGMDIQDQQAAIPRLNIDDEAIRIELAQKVRQIALLEGIQKDFAELDDIASMMQQANIQLQLLFSLSPAIFFFTDSEQTDLTGISIPHKKNRPANVFKVTLKTGHSLIAESALQQIILDTRHQIIFSELPIIDRQILTTLGSSHLICLPLIYQHILIGVIVSACNSTQAKKFQQDNQLLRLFATQLAESFARQQQLSHQHLQQLEQKQQENELHIRQIIHEANNPLTTINNYLEILSMSMQQETASLQHIETIQSEVDRVSNILLQLKDDYSQSLEDQSEVDVNQLINKLIALYRPTLYKLNNIQCQLELDQNLALISSDPDRIKQIIANLVKNASEALPANGIISIKTKSLVILNQKKYIEISIADNGDGIPDAMLEKLFTPVQSSKGGNHSGLGLTIVSKLVKELNGSISYRSSDQGGAEFIILLNRD
ncbi:MAG: HDOD domain-containing protein [Gammaproteobacteria bacterium]|nr:HDOD domain-containing protein [Gammaproteobacteria bacterium]MBL6998348.1 HDOD domain-containing protein [Gammaproteobacteria bacterium]